MPAGLDRSRLHARLLAHLEDDGPLSTSDISARLNVSPRTARNLVRELEDQLLIAGQARATRVHARRTIDGSDQFTVVEVHPDGRTATLDVLRPVGARGFWGELSGRTYAGLPYFLYDMQPTGFLGRLVPQQYPRYPANIDVWTGDDALHYLAHHAWDAPGNLIVGDAFRQFLQPPRPPHPVTRQDRAQRYPALALDMLQLGVPGSSAGGEQPKFLATRDGTPVLVKFSPPLNERLGRRIGDLMVCEHLVHEVLLDLGVASSRSNILDSAGHRFLEIERFDRTEEGRRGVISLLALDAEFVGEGRGWAAPCQALVRQGLLGQADAEHARRMEWFGRLIANSDMHQGNLSFFRSGFDIEGLAPCYDMLPMLYAPRAGHIVEQSFELPLPSPEDATAYGWAAEAAMDFWERVGSDPRVSEEFQPIAAMHQGLAETLRQVVARLPM